MATAAIAVMAAAVFAWTAVSARAGRSDMTAPIAFVTLGLLLHESIPVDAHLEAAAVKVVAEVTLVWVLFSDAARVGVQELRENARIFVRLLAFALPLTVLLGWLLAAGVFHALDIWLALLVGAALAPTDAALGTAVVTNEAVPARVRTILNVESGLNDGIVTPFVFVAIAGAAHAEGHGGGIGAALVALLVGAGIGIAVGFGGGAVLRGSRRRGWTEDAYTGPGVLALALLAYVLALSCDGNGFVAAFVGGLAFGAASRGVNRSEVRYVEETSDLAALVVWTLFGAIAVPLLAHASAWRLLVYAVLSLTLVRMGPVFLLLLRSGVDSESSLFIGWFGPRGLASVVFALLAIEELGDAADTAVAIIVATVLLSVFAHGLTATPLSSAFAARSRQPQRERSTDSQVRTASVK